MGNRSQAELEAENNELRQLLQAGVMLAEAVIAGDDVEAALQAWIDAVNAAFSA